jgi:hypothetical protein
VDLEEKIPLEKALLIQRIADELSSSDGMLLNTKTDLRKTFTKEQITNGINKISVAKDLPILPTYLGVMEFMCKGAANVNASPALRVSMSGPTSSKPRQDKQ